MDRAALDERVEHVDRMLKAHAGGVELESVTSEGDVVVRFTGMCTGCLYKPVTMAATVRKELMTVHGVQSVRCVGGRVSEEIEERLAYYFGDQYSLDNPLPR